MCEVFDWNTEGSRQTEISKLQDPFSINEEILRFEVAMKDLVLMAFRYSIQQLE